MSNDGTHIPFFHTQRNGFDLFVHDEPFHALQLLIDTTDRRWMVRVWGRTKVRGHLPETDQEPGVILEQICWSTFHRQVPCLGIVGKEIGDEEVYVTDFPIQREVSRQVK